MSRVKYLHALPISWISWSTDISYTFKWSKSVTFSHQICVNTTWSLKHLHEIFHCLFCLLLCKALKGISRQPKTGFLTFVEAMRYCEVGWFLKNPYYPVWILGSETHLTVLASPDMSLVSKNVKSEINSISGLRQAEAEFNYLSPDQDTGGFISSSDFEKLLTKLRLSTGSQQ